MNIREMRAYLKLANHELRTAEKHQDPISRGGIDITSPVFLRSLKHARNHVRAVLAELVLHVGE